MTSEFDFTDIAEQYALHPNYAPKAIHMMLEKAKMNQTAEICEMGAGAGRLTVFLAQNGFSVTAIEPNEAMRSIGEARTSEYPNVRWVNATAENSGQESRSFDMVIFSSSFDLVDRMEALKECARILFPGGWFACMWNHRDLNDPIQATIEDFITNTIPAYSYGIAREDQSQILQDSNLFGNVQRVNQSYTHFLTIDECMAYWQSHTTLIQQAGDKFDTVLAGIEKILQGSNQHEIEIPFNTRIWMSRLK